MLVILPPSETKEPGGENDPMELSFPELNPVRNHIMDVLAAIPAEEQLAFLKISPRLIEQAEANTVLRTAPTMSSIYRYTGVLFDALDAATLPDDALAHILIGSALFGVTRATDAIPAYRLSGNTTLPGKLTLRSLWKDALTPTLEGLPEFIVDMRSGAYLNLGPITSPAVGMCTVRVETQQPDGSRKVVSHFNKHYKGELARYLAMNAQQATTLEEIASIARVGGFHVETSGTQLTLITPDNK